MNNRETKVRSKVPLEAQNSVAELASPRAAVKAAIAAANYMSVGAPFSPFLMKFAAAEDFSNIWSSERGKTPIRFYMYIGQRSDGFLPLGDYAVTEAVPFIRTPIMLLGQDPNHLGALAHPTGFTWILDDGGSGNSNHIDYWWPNAPEGYRAVGICVSNGGTPNPANYWCVSDEYLQDARTTPYWDDAGQRWKHHIGNLSCPSIGNAQAGNSLLLAPTTILSDEYTSSQSGNTNSHCLVVNKLFLPVPGATVPSPTDSDNYGSGIVTAQGIVNVAVLPCNVVVDTNLGGEPQNSPFYYLAGQPYWECTQALASVSGGIYQTSYTVGTSSESSKAFQETNSVTVAANVGVEAGASGGFGAHLSASYTCEMQVAKSSSIRNGTETTEHLSLNLPPASRILLWQKTVEFVTYRTDGSSLSTASYRTSEITFSASSG